MINIINQLPTKVTPFDTINAIAPFIDAFAYIGFRRNQIIQKYEFQNLFGKDNTRTVDLGIFGREPFDYKSACFAVQIVPEGLSVVETANSILSFGASQFFLILNGRTERWSHTVSGPKFQDSFPTQDTPNFIRANRNKWNPESMMRIRSGFQQPLPEQIDFVDLGLISALEREAANKTDSLIKRVLSLTESYDKKHRFNFDAQSMFKILFSLLTAKLLTDRGISLKGGIDFSKPVETVKAVNAFYKFKNQNFNKSTDELLTEISSMIRESFSFKNLSVDTLTYVYENTFVTNDKRKEYGIHSTPSYLADFIIANLPLNDLPPEKLNLLDPMCGHSIFLIAAMRRFRELLPSKWEGPQRHKFFTESLHGIEIDAFACEVARMCLTLADFPQPDGWDIRHQDVFKGNILKELASKVTIVVGNPPFEDIPKMSPKTPKPKELLNRILPIIPKGGLIGIVLPKSFLSGNDYKNERKYFLDEFTIINVIELPERIFTHATVETCVVTAQKSKLKKKAKYSIIDRASRDLFKSKLYIPYVDEVKQEYFTTTQHNQIIVPILRELWDYLDKNPRLEKFAIIHKGVEHKLGLISNDRERVAKTQLFPNSQPGLLNVTDDLFQFTVGTKEYLSMDMKNWRNQKSKTWQLPWNTSKIIVPASRLSNSHWRFAALIDREGLIVGRRFYAIWAKNERFSLEFLGALLNSPLAQAYCFTHSFQQDTRARIYESIPLPHTLPLPNNIIDGLVKSYIVFTANEQYDLALQTLLKIDAELLKLYELPPRLERKLLDFFWGHKRRVPFDFTGYIPPSFESWIPLHLYISDEYQKATIGETLDRLPIITNKTTIQYLKEL